MMMGVVPGNDVIQHQAQMVPQIVVAGTIPMGAKFKLLYRHGRTCSGHPRRSAAAFARSKMCRGPTWVTGTSPVMTGFAVWI
jgi:hypothetical protein